MKIHALRELCMRQTSSLMARVKAVSNSNGGPQRKYCVYATV